MFDASILDAAIIKVQIFASDIPDIDYFKHSVGFTFGREMLPVAAVGGIGAMAIAAGASAGAVNVAACAFGAAYGVYLNGLPTFNGPSPAATAYADSVTAGGAAVFHHDMVLFTCLTEDEKEVFITIEKLTHGIVIQLAAKKESVKDFLVDRVDKTKMNLRANPYQVSLETDDCHPDWRYDIIMTQNPRMRQIFCH